MDDMDEMDEMAAALVARCKPLDARFGSGAISTPGQAARAMSGLDASIAWAWAHEVAVLAGVAVPKGAPPVSRAQARAALGQSLAAAVQAKERGLRWDRRYYDLLRIQGLGKMGCGELHTAMAKVGLLPRDLDAKGNSPLHHLAAENCVGAIKGLLEWLGPRAGRCELARVNHAGRSPAQSAMAHGAWEAIKAMDEAWDSFPVNHERAIAAAWSEPQREDDPFAVYHGDGGEALGAFKAMLEAEVLARSARLPLLGGGRGSTGLAGSRLRL